MYTRVQTNIESLLRELSGPRPLHRVVDIVSKPRIWSRGAEAISFENWPTLQVKGLGRTVIILLQPYCTLAFTSTHDYSVTSVYVRWKFSEIEEWTSLGGTLLRRIYIPNLMDSHLVTMAAEVPKKEITSHARTQYRTSHGPLTCRTDTPVSPGGISRLFPS